MDPLLSTCNLMAVHVFVVFVEEPSALFTSKNIHDKMMCALSHNNARVVLSRMVALYGSDEEIWTTTIEYNIRGFI